MKRRNFMATAACASAVGLDDVWRCDNELVYDQFCVELTKAIAVDWEIPVRMLYGETDAAYADRIKKRFIN